MVQATIEKRIVFYRDEKGEEPCARWIDNLKDVQGQQRIRARLRRLAAGLYGDCAPVGEGVLELRMFFGPGYRLYFGEDVENLIILLCGGDKSSQGKDIETAKAYWKEYKENG